ncbi:MAG: hypothetical protein MJZ76_03780 [Bacteroidales bacterium]|nr:hypothetical protein [Bacteroidales bacterium]
MKKISLLLVLVILFVMPKSFSQKRPYAKKDDSHFVFETSVGLLAGMGNIVFNKEEGKRSLPNNKNFVVDVHQLIGYQFNPYVTLGVGAGVDVWKRTAFIPIFGNISVNMLDLDYSPYWYANAGYAFKWYVTSQPEKITKVIYGANPGFQAETGLGLRIKMKDTFTILLLAHYKLQQSSIHYSVDVEGETHYPSLTTNRSENMLYHYVGLKIGFLYF